MSYVTSYVLLQAVFVEDHTHPYRLSTAACRASGVERLARLFTLLAPRDPPLLCASRLRLRGHAEPRLEVKKNLIEGGVDLFNADSSPGLGELRLRAEALFHEESDGAARVISRHRVERLLNNFSTT